MMFGSRGEPNGWDWIFSLYIMQSRLWLSSGVCTSWLSSGVCARLLVVSKKKKMKLKNNN